MYYAVFYCNIVLIYVSAEFESVMKDVGMEAHYYIYSVFSISLGTRFFQVPGIGI